MIKRVFSSAVSFVCALRRTHLVVGLLWMMILTFTLIPKQAYAFSCTCDYCTCSSQEFIDNSQENTDLHIETMIDEFGSVVDLFFPLVFENLYYDSGGWLDIEGEEQGTERMGEHQTFVWQLWFDNFLPVWMHMAEQLTQNMMWHTFAIGTFIDAKYQLETQALLQERTAEVHKRYQPSTSMCVFGTNVRSLAAAERRSELTAHSLNQRLLDRQLGTEGGLGIMGPRSDQAGRVRFFLQYVCDRFDNNRIHNNPETGFANICQAQPRTDGTVNLDLDFTRLVMNPRTLNVDFTNPGNPQNNRGNHIFNLGANLYGHKVPSTIIVGSEGQVGLHSQLLDLRSIIAKRSVAQTSYSAIVGLKARGSPVSGTETMQYMTILLQELGLTAAEVTNFVGENPSYYAQLEIMAKKIYQNPDFYRDLYDKPENTNRKSVAMSAISSMLDREIYESQLRAEAMTSQLLELKVLKSQDAVEDSFSGKGDR